MPDEEIVPLDKTDNVYLGHIVFFTSLDERLAKDFPISMDIHMGQGIVHQYFIVDRGFIQ